MMPRRSSRCWYYQVKYHMRHYTPAIGMISRDILLRGRIISTDLVNVIPLNGKLSDLIGLDSAPARTPTCSQLILQLTFGNCVFNILALSYASEIIPSPVWGTIFPGLSVTCVSWEDCKISSGARAFLWNSRCGSRERSRARSRTGTSLSGW